MRIISLFQNKIRYYLNKCCKYLLETHTMEATASTV